MKFRLSTSEPPHGRCLVFAKHLEAATRARPEWCLQIAQQLYDGQFPPEAALSAEAVDSTKLAVFEAACRECGIVLQREP